uniref:Uncharacterized protein n=1 Tax=Anopheles atroparvus TaxID=41427 RepID=A0A182IUF6_ANOAO
MESLSQWHKQLSSSTSAARGEKATCRRPSRPSPTAPQLDDQREENINFYGGLVQRSHREANFSPPERLPHAGTPLLHDDACSEPAGKAALLLSAGVGATAAPAVASHCSSPFVEEDGDTAWMNTTTTMVESCSPSAPIDWWKLDSSSSSLFMGGDTARGAKASGSSGSTGERLRLDARKTDQIGGGAVSFTTETSVDCGTLLARAPGGDDGGSPISLHEEIEQLSSGFDCDATNHLVSTSSAALELPFLASPSDEQQHGETMSLNILKWLQEDISSTIIVDRQQPQQQPQQQQQQHQHQHQQPQGLGGDILAAAISNSPHFLTDSAAIALSPSPADRLRLPLLEATFENSLDQIQTLNRSPTPAVGAGGGHKTALKSESSGSGRRHSDDPSAAAAAAAFSTAAATSSSTTTTTTATNASSVDPQCDHNYFTMKRRIQDSGGGGGGDAHTSTKHKIIKLTDEHERQQGGHHRSVKDSVTRSAPAASCWCADDASVSTLQPRTTTGGPHKPNGRQSAASAAPLPAASHDHTTTTATTVAGTFERRPSVAHRKAPTLKVHVGGGIAPTSLAASLLSGQDPFLALNKTPMMTTTTTIATTTTTTTTNLINQHRMLPQVTLNTPDLTNDILDLEDEKFDLLSFIDTNDDSLDLNKYHSVVDEKPALEAVLPSASLKEGEGEEESHEGQQGLAAPKQSDANSGSSNSSSSSTSSSSTSSVKNSPEKKVYPFLTLDSLRQMTASTTDASEDSTMARSALSSSTASLLRTQQHHLTAHLGSSNSNYSMGSRSSASSVCGDSDVSSSTTAQTPKRRGRPPKAVGTVRDRSQYEHLSEADWRYREQRDKNNEASRKSRINRKDRELKLESEADRLNMQHQKLSYEERRLQRDCQKWRKAVMKLALL